MDTDKKTACLVSPTATTTEGLSASSRTFASTLQNTIGACKSTTVVLVSLGFGFEHIVYTFWPSVLVNSCVLLVVAPHIYNNPSQEECTI